MDAAYCALTDTGVFEVTGSDARDFLNGQLSVDVDAAPGTAPLAAWSAANGRVRVLARVVPYEAGYLLLAPAGMHDMLLRKLGMFVLRADVRIEQSTTRAVGAVVGAAPEWLAARGLDAPGERDRTETIVDEVWIHAGPGLAYVVGPEEDLEGLAKLADAAPRAAVELAEIELGLPQIVPETSERFLPQMLDLDVLGGVAFDKGCFPGQEVIARTQNLGTVKRRLRRFAVDGAAPEPGAALVTDTGDEAGQVLRAASHDGRTELLAVARLDTPAAALHCATADGPPLTELELEREPGRAAAASEAQSGSANTNS